MRRESFHRMGEGNGKERGNKTLVRTIQPPGITSVFKSGERGQFGSMRN